MADAPKSGKHTKRAGKKPPRAASKTPREKAAGASKHGGKFKHKTRERKGAGVADVAVVEITRINDDGDAVCTPVPWDSRREPPYILLAEAESLKPAPGIGDRALVRLTRTDRHQFTAHVIKLLAEEQPQNILGVYNHAGDYGVIQSVSRRDKKGWYVHADASMQASHGELVAGETLPKLPPMRGLPQARVTETLGELTSARSASIIAIHLNEIPTRFPDAALRQAEEAKPPVLERGRVDLRPVPLITIDGEDARDFDDAIFAEPTKDGFHLIVAIADVAYYVTEHSPLDREAFTRGNSVYFPDRVVPMLPEALSNGLCSLKPEEDRYCVAVHLWIDAQGQMKRYEFVRALMRSHARMTYTQTQEIADKGEHPIISPLYAAYRALARDRDTRGALDLNLPEYKVHLNEAGNVDRIGTKERLESHRLIESYMIAANVAAADFLMKHKGHGIYRVHDAPDEMKLGDLRALLEHMGYHLSKGEGVRPAHFNKVLAKSTGTAEQLIVHQSILRSQMQAFYAPANKGHFGLGLTQYAHFTSPIRRYADLIVHREIVRILDGNARTHADREDAKHAAAAADHISVTERKAMQAERDAMDRYRASFMSDKVGDSFHGVITGMNDSGLYVTLPENGVTGFVPIRTLGQDFFHYDKKHGEMHGQRTRAKFTLGDALMIRVEAANSATGNLIFIPDRPLSETQDLTGRSHFSKTKHRPKHKAHHGKGPENERGPKGKHTGKRRK